MQTQWHIEIDSERQTLTHQLTQRVRVVVDLQHATRTVAKDGAALDICKIEPDTLRHYRWLLRIAEDAKQVNSQTNG